MIHLQEAASLPFDEMLTSTWATNRASRKLPYEEMHAYKAAVGETYHRWAFTHQYDDFDLHTVKGYAQAAFVSVILWAYPQLESHRSLGWEVFALTPEDAREHMGYDTYVLCWESGPSHWGLFPEDRCPGFPPTNRKIFTETHWGFDVIVTEIP